MPDPDSDARIWARWVLAALLAVLPALVLIAKAIKPYLGANP